MRALLLPLWSPLKIPCLARHHHHAGVQAVKNLNLHLSRAAEGVGGKREERREGRREGGGIATAT